MAVNSGEPTNFTYKISDIGMTYLHSLSPATGASIEQARGWLREPEENEELEYLTMKHHIGNEVCDDIPRLARRLVWYALGSRNQSLWLRSARQGRRGSALFCGQENVEEGHQGYYVGTDINPKRVLTRWRLFTIRAVIYGD